MVDHVGQTNNPAAEQSPLSNTFNWSDFWKKSGSISTFTEGPLVTTYYQKDRQQQLIQLFDEIVGQLSPAGRVLDVGCGNGAGSVSLLNAAARKQRTLNIDGIDSADICPPESLSTRVHFRKGRAEELDYPDNTFGLVLSCFAVEFFEIMSFLKQCRRVLEPGGQAVFLTYARESPMVSKQSRYVGVYENGLKELINIVLIGRKVDMELIARIRHHIQEDVPQPQFRKHLNQIVDCLNSLPLQTSGISSLIDHPFLPNVDGAPNIHSLSTLRSFFSLLQVIHYAALTAPAARDLVRQIERSGFNPCSVVPLEFQGMLLCWLFTAE